MKVNANMNGYFVLNNNVHTIPGPWHLLGVGKVMGSMLGPNQVKAIDVNSCTYCCYVRCATLTVLVGGIPWPQTGVQSKGWLSAMIEI